MKAKRRRVAGSPATAGAPAADSFTADLFEAPRPPVRLAALPARGNPRVRAPQLWYAVVFSGLSEPQAAQLLPRLCLHAQRFTSLVSIELPDALLLEINGSIKLFGSLEVLHAGIDAAWSALSLQTCSAAAPTTLAALWCARAGKRLRIEDSSRLSGELADLPIACTSWDPQWLQTLRSMGVRRLGELLRLPRGGVAKRLSPVVVAHLDIALGRQPAPRRGFVPQERFGERCDFETEVETVVYLQKALEPLVERCARFLRTRQAGVQSLELTLRHRLLPITRLRVGLASVTGERRRLEDVLHEKLSRLELPAPVRGMRLVSGVLQPLPADSLDAFGKRSGVHAATAPQLVERLRARLGTESVYGVCWVQEHRPEAAWQRVGTLQLALAQRQVMEVRDEASRPVWLLAEPALLHAGAVALQDLILEQGPERIESGWWDGKDVVRDYYVARRPQGARWWVFQERRTGCWYLHGVFS